MPPWQQCRLREREPAHPLSWLSIPRRVASMTADGLYGRQRLVDLRHQLHTHKIAYFGASHKAWVISRHSRHFYRATLHSLLELDHVPWLVRVPMNHLPHDCFHCQGVALPPPPFSISLQSLAGKAGPAWRIESGYQRVSLLSIVMTASLMRTAAVPKTGRQWRLCCRGGRVGPPFRPNQGCVHHVPRVDPAFNGVHSVWS